MGGQAQFNSILPKLQKQVKTLSDLHICRSLREIFFGVGITIQRVFSTSVSENIAAKYSMNDLETRVFYFFSGGN